MCEMQISGVKFQTETLPSDCVFRGAFPIVFSSRLFQAGPFPAKENVIQPVGGGGAAISGITF